VVKLCNILILALHVGDHSVIGSVLIVYLLKGKEENKNGNKNG